MASPLSLAKFSPWEVQGAVRLAQDDMPGAWNDKFAVGLLATRRTAKSQWRPPRENPNQHQRQLARGRRRASVASRALFTRSRRAYGNTHRLRDFLVRRLYGAHQRRSGKILHGAGGPGRWRGSNHD